MGHATIVTPADRRIGDAHQDYPATETLTYMDVAARGLISRQVRAALDAHLDGLASGNVHKDDFFALVERTRERFAAMIHAHADEIAFTKNVSEGLNMVATGLPWEAGDNVIVCPELEHPNNVYCWLNLRQQGIDVRTVEPRQGSLPVDEMIERMDARTRAVTASTVTFAPGFRTDIDRLGQACREHGAFFLVDAAQSCGVLQTDVDASSIDGLAGFLRKKACLGFTAWDFSIAAASGPSACNRLIWRGLASTWAMPTKPPWKRRLSAHARGAALRRRQLQFPRLRRGGRLDGTIIGVRPSRAGTLCGGTGASTGQGFMALDLPVCGGAPGPHLANIITVGELGSSHYGTDDARFNQLYAYLHNHGVRLSIRRGVLRFSLHVYNTQDDINRVLELTREGLRS